MSDACYGKDEDIQQPSELAAHLIFFISIEAILHLLLTLTTLLKDAMIRKKSKNVFRFFERWVRCEGLPFFVWGAVRKLS